MRIYHLRHNEIDFPLWDETIRLSLNQFGYGYSWYLNIVSPGWEALVTENYDFIMPLPVKRKFGLPYIVQPILTQQLGIFSSQTISNDIFQFFISKIPYYSYEINMNDCNGNDADLISRPNYVLALNKSYEELRLGFSKNTIRNIYKSEKQNISIDKNVLPDDFLILYFSIEKTYSQANEIILKQLLSEGTKQGLIMINGVRNSENELIAGLCFLISGQRIIYLVAVSDDEGKQTSAMFMLLDNVIRSHAQTNCLLDFEGSDIEGVARFYKSFGAVNRPYYVLKKFRPAFLVGKI